MLRQIKDFPNYAISDKGYVLNIKTGKVLKSFNVRGYLHVTPSKDGVKKKFKIHRLVATHFINNPKNKKEVNHIDGDKTNNHVSNLEWTTRSENVQHSYDTGLKKGVINCPKRSKPVQGTCIKTGSKITFPSTMEAQRNGFDNRGVSSCCNGREKTHKGYTWRYI